jgi:hypothetical protein
MGGNLQPQVTYGVVYALIPFLVVLLPYDHEVMDSNSGNSLSQKCREMFCT